MRLASSTAASRGIPGAPSSSPCRSSTSVRKKSSVNGVGPAYGPATAKSNSLSWNGIPGCIHVRMVWAGRGSSGVASRQPRVELVGRRAPSSPRGRWARSWAPPYGSTGTGQRPDVGSGQIFESPRHRGVVAFVLCSCCSAVRVGSPAGSDQRRSRCHLTAVTRPPRVVSSRPHGGARGASGSGFEHRRTVRSWQATARPVAATLPCVSSGPSSCPVKHVPQRLAKPCRQVVAFLALRDRPSRAPSSRERCGPTARRVARRRRSARPCGSSGRSVPGWSVPTVRRLR